MTDENNHTKKLHENGQKNEEFVKQSKLVSSCNSSKETYSNISCNKKGVLLPTSFDKLNLLYHFQSVDEFPIIEKSRHRLSLSNPAFFTGLTPSPPLSARLDPKTKIGTIFSSPALERMKKKTDLNNNDIDTNNICLTASGKQHMHRYYGRTISASPLSFTFHTQKTSCKNIEPDNNYFQRQQATISPNNINHKKFSRAQTVDLTTSISETDRYHISHCKKSLKFGPKTFKPQQSPIHENSERYGHDHSNNQEAQNINNPHENSDTAFNNSELNNACLSTKNDVNRNWHRIRSSPSLEKLYLVM